MVKFVNSKRHNIRKNIVKAVNLGNSHHTLNFPSVMEKSFKRVEDAAKYLAHLRELGIDSHYPKDDILGYDAHTVTSVVHDINDFIKCI